MKVLIFLQNNLLNYPYCNKPHALVSSMNGYRVLIFLIPILMMVNVMNSFLC